MSYNIDKEKACAFTGHREVGGDLDIGLLDRHISTVIDNGVTTFLCGMAMGFDLIAAARTLEFKKNNKNLRLIACVPCPGQQKNFPLAEKKKYEEILSCCDEIILLSQKYYNGCMLARDRFMVDNAANVIAYERKNRGGTYYTLKYALAANRKMFFI